MVPELLTVIENGGQRPVLPLPSLTLDDDVRPGADVGAGRRLRQPARRVLNTSHAGLFGIEHLSGSPSGSEAVGRKL